MRQMIDKILRACIRVCMLTGVTFLVTACYGPRNPPQIDSPDYKNDCERVEHQLQQAATQQHAAEQQNKAAE